jgi:hypothetical protein
MLWQLRRLNRSGDLRQRLRRRKEGKRSLHHVERPSPAELRPPRSTCVAGQRGVQRICPVDGETANWNKVPN